MITAAASTAAQDERALMSEIRARRPVLEPIRRRILQPLFARLGYDILPATPEWEHRPLSTRERERLFEGAAAQLEADLAAAGLPVLEDADLVVRRFFDLVLKSPVRQKHGGSGFNGALQLFAVATALQPSVIVESGVFRGFTTWVLRQACPDAKLFCFDATLGQLRYRDERATYVEADWTTFDWSGVKLAGAFGFFDDHISQADRVIEARERGLARLLFDDDTAAHRIHAHGGPAFPTITMALDPQIVSEPVRWLRNGREFVYRPDAGKLASVRSAIARAHHFHDLHAVTGYSPSRLTYVHLNDR